MVFCALAGPASWLFSALWGLHRFSHSSLSDHRPHVPCRDTAPRRPKSTPSPPPNPHFLSLRSTLSSSLVPIKSSSAHSNLHPLPRTRVGACPAPASACLYPVSASGSQMRGNIKHQELKILPGHVVRSLFALNVFRLSLFGR